jgi:hypothetical protein
LESSDGLEEPRLDAAGSLDNGLVLAGLVAPAFRL